MSDCAELTKRYIEALENALECEITGDVSPDAKDEVYRLLDQIRKDRDAALGTVGSA